MQRVSAEVKKSLLGEIRVFFLATSLKGSIHNNSPIYIYIYIYI
jgi:hypothetical protein